MYYDIDSIKMKTGCHPMMKLINCSNSNVNMGKIFFYTSWQLFQPGPGEHSCCWLSSLISTTRIMLTHTSTYTENIIIAAFTIDTLILCMKIMSRSELTPDTGHGAEITMHYNVSTDNIFSHTRKWHTHFNSSLSKLLELKQIFAHNRHACPDSVLINSSFCSVNISFRRSLHYLVFFNINIDVCPFKIL